MNRNEITYKEHPFGKNAKLGKRVFLKGFPTPVEIADQEIRGKLEAVRKIQQKVKKLPGYKTFRADWIKSHKTISDALWE